MCIRDRLILAAVVVMYLVLGILYESFIHPLTILSTLPSAAVGALLALELTHTELGVMALIGIVLLTLKGSCWSARWPVTPSRWNSRKTVKHRGWTPKRMSLSPRPVSYTHHDVYKSKLSESFLHPLTILSTLPSAGTGA